MTRLDLSVIRAAHARIRDKIHRTPVVTSRSLDLESGGSLFFKCENFQKAGAFKARGATNAVFSLTDDEVSSGVITHSSGNHAAALARAARLRGVRAYLVMPSDTSPPKQAAVQRYGGDIVLCAPTLQAREETCARLIEDTGATLVHPYNDYRTMAGQGTAALELLEDVADLDLVLVPVGGGGLLSGTAVAAKALAPNIQVIGVEPEQADDAYRSFKSGALVRANPRTIAEGLRTSLGDLTFPIIRESVDDIVLVSEAAIAAAMRRIWEVLKIVVEASAAVPYAAILEHPTLVRGRRTGLVLTGGNVNLDDLPW